MRQILEALGGRKFLLTLVVLALAAVIELKTERGISEQFVALLIGVLGVFNAANAMITSKAIWQPQPVIENVEVKDAEPRRSSTADATIDAALDAILTKQSEHSEVLASVAKGVSQTNGVLAALATKR